MPPFPLPRVLIMECPFPRLLLRRFRVHLAARRRPLVLRAPGLGRRLLALFDQGPHAVAALLADLLVERSAPLGLDRFAALLADLLVEAGAALRLHRLAALLADLFVEGVPVLVAHRLAALAACLRHAHRALLLARVLFSHSRPPQTPLSGANWFRPRRDDPRREPRSAFRPAAIKSRTRWPPSLPISW